MKKLLAGFIIVCLTLGLFLGSFGTIPSARADITEGHYTYTVAGGNATITSYTGSGGTVAIPDKLGGYPVVGIGGSSDSNVEGGGGVFEAHPGLTSVTIPTSVTSIGDIAFRYCTALTSVTIGSGVISIGDVAFGDCGRLTSITVDAGNSSYSSSEDGVLFNKVRTTLVQYLGGKHGAYVIPASVTSIGDKAFDGCTGLTSVTIPASVTSIGACAFYGCTGLTSVTIPNSVTRIGATAFQYCSALISVTMPDNVDIEEIKVRDTATWVELVFYGCAPSFTIHYTGGAMEGTSGQTGQNKGSKIILFFIIFLLALLIIFGLRYKLRRQAKQK